MGCSSEIDKCVNSQIRAWEIEKKEAQKRLDATKDGVRLANVWEDMVTTTTPKEKFEADARIKCMQAAH